MNEQVLIFDPQSGFALEPLSDSQSLGEHNILVRPKYVGICGSDLHFLEICKKKSSLGHEWIGIVEKIGSKVTNFRPQDWVTSGVKLPCGECPRCLSSETDYCSKPKVLGVETSALRTFLIASEAALVKLPETKNASATLFEILAVAENTWIKTHHSLKPNSRVLILGAGSLGLSCALVFQREGHQIEVVETIPSRVARASALGFSANPLAFALLEESFKDSFDVVIDASGDHLNGQGGWKYLAHFGCTGFLAVMLAKYTKEVNLKSELLASKEAQLQWVKGCTLYSLKKAIESWLPKIESLGKLMITHQFSFQESGKAFDMAQDRGQSGKVIIKLHD